MEKIEVTGKTVEEALTNALLKLETTSDKVEYEVLEKVPQESSVSSTASRLRSLYGRKPLWKIT